MRSEEGTERSVFSCSCRTSVLTVSVNAKCVPFQMVYECSLFSAEIWKVSHEWAAVHTTFVLHAVGIPVTIVIGETVLPLRCSMKRQIYQIYECIKFLFLYIFVCVLIVSVKAF